MLKRIEKNRGYGLAFYCLLRVGVITARDVLDMV